MSDFACQLQREAIIHLRGKNIPAFLQGQLTCDTRPLHFQQAIAGAFCSVKGRVISDLIIVQLTDEHCILRLRSSVAQAFAESLARYAQFSRITVTVGDDCAILGVYAHDAHTSPGFLEVSKQGDIWRLYRGFGMTEFLSLDSPERLDPIADGYQQGRESDWRAMELATGHFAIETEDTETFTPQTLNYDVSGRVAFDKGCYTGQEVIARLHYKGKSKRRVQVYRCVAGPDITRDEVVSDSDGTSIGKVLRREHDRAGATNVAAEVQADARQQPAALVDGRVLEPLTPFWIEAPTTG